MAELGSHQLDAAGIFISGHAHRRREGPAADGLGRRRPVHLPAGPRCEDHVYCIVRVPRPRATTKDPEQEDRRHLFVDQRQRLRRLRRNRDGHQGDVDPRARAGSDALQGMPPRRPASRSTKGKGGARRSTPRPAAAPGGGRRPRRRSTGPVSRGYTEEMEHWAWCIRNPDSEQHAAAATPRWPWATP